MNINDQHILLWKRYQNGDSEAYTDIFRLYYPALYQFGFKIAGNSAMLEDCIQELFTELWQNKSQTDVQSVKAYLLKSLKYKILRALRKPGPSRVSEDEKEYGFELSHESLLISEEESTEKAQKVVSAMSQLSNRQKEILYLRFYQGLSYEEISEIMNINYQVSRNLLYQAIKAMKKLITVFL